jgi:hypothetical protein
MSHVSTARPGQGKAKSAIHAANGIWEGPPVLKEALMELTLGRSGLEIWVFLTRSQTNSSWC